MTTQINRSFHLLLLFAVWSLSLASCAGDPWPEPDTMENSDVDAPTNGENGDSNGGEYDDVTDTDVDSGKDTGAVDGDVDGDADADTERDTETSADEAIGIEDEYLHLEDHIYVSAPDEDGWITIAALPGAVPAGRTVACFVAGTEVAVPLGLERGFAVRAAAAVGDILSIAVSDTKGVVAILPTTVASDESPSSWSGFIGSAAGATVLNASYLSVAGNGAALVPDRRVIGANMTRFTAVSAPVWCDDAGCRFELTLPGTLSDEIDLFTVPAGGRLGTVSATMPIP